MGQCEAAAAWRLFSTNWIAIAALAMVLVAGVALTDFSVTLDSIAVPVGVAAAFGGAAYVLMAVVRRRGLMPAFMLGGLSQLILVSAPMVPLTYLAAGFNLPLQDANLVALDKMLGLDWRGLLDFTNAHPALGQTFGHAYDMLRWEMLLVPLALAGARRYIRLQQFTLVVALTLSATTLISIFVPALGTFYGLGLSVQDSVAVVPSGYLDQVRDLPLVRDGSLRVLELGHLVGVIAFPSFHAASAVLYMWALWPIRWLRAGNVIMNGVMLASTPIVGGHYFIDVLAGIAVAVLGIAAACRIGAWVTRRAEAQAPAIPEGVLAAE